MSNIVKFNFRGDDLDVIPRDGDAFVVVKRVCEVLDIAEQAQATKLRQNPAAVTTMIVATGSDGKKYEMFCISVRSLPLWLATIHPSKVSAATRDKLVAYQREVADVLADHFLGSRRPATATSSQQLDDVLRRLETILGHVERTPSIIRGAKLRDNLYLAAPIKRRFKVLGKVCDETFQKTHGRFRHDFGVTSYLNTSVFDLPVVVAWFDAQLGGGPALPPGNDGGQMKLFGGAA